MGAGEMLLQLQVLSASRRPEYTSKDPCLVAHNKAVTPTLGDLVPLPLPQAPALTHTHPHTGTQRHMIRNNNSKSFLKYIKTEITFCMA